MKKYATITNEKTKECSVGIGTDKTFYEAIGMQELEVEQAYNGKWYIVGYAPRKPQVDINAERIRSLKQKLLETDYIASKIAEGSATKEEYAEVIKNRQAWRAEINVLEG